MVQYSVKKCSLYDFSNHDLIKIVNRAKENDNQAIEHLLAVFDNFIRNLSKKYTKDSSLIDDLMQEGKISLLYAINNFNEYKSDNFKLYAILWIKQSIYRCYEKNIDTISIPVRKKQILRKVKAAQKEAIEISGSEDEENRIVEEINTEILKYDYSYVSFESETNSLNENSKAYAEKIYKEDETTPVDAAAESEFLADLYSAVNELEEREKIVIYYRFGLKSYPELTLKEISKFFDLSSESIRKIEKKALELLKRKLSLKHSA